MSTIEELKEEKFKLENIITGLLEAFENKYNVSVANVDVETSKPLGSAKPKLYAVKLEVKI